MTTTTLENLLSGSTNSDRPDGVPLDHRLRRITHTADRLRNELEAIFSSHGLDRRQLLAVQGGLVRLQRRGTAPTANDFWMATARPRADLLTQLAKATINAELTALVAGENSTFECTILAADAASSSVVTNGTAGTANCTAVVRAVSRRPRAIVDDRHEQAVAALLAAIPARDSLDELGRWWQRRLRRAATIRAFPTLAGTAAKGAELVVSQFEMQLLDESPWSHGDRLLSAFELAESDIRRFAQARIAETVNILCATSGPALNT